LEKGQQVLLPKNESPVCQKSPSRCAEKNGLQKTYSLSFGDAKRFLGLLEGREINAISYNSAEKNFYNLTGEAQKSKFADNPQRSYKIYLEINWRRGRFMGKTLRRCFLLGEG